MYNRPVSLSYIPPEVGITKEKAAVLFLVVGGEL